MRLGILGGTFDPPHVGHLLAASDALEALGLDQLVLVPAAQQPLKVGTVGASAVDRLAMTRLLVEGQPAMSVDPMEIERPGLSFSVDTLEAFGERYPAADRHFLVGMDVLRSFHLWREPRRVLGLARLVVLRRGDDSAAAVVEAVAAVAADAAPPVVLETRRVDVSSTEVRARVRAGKSIRGFVPDAVAAYVERAALYR